jgi:hypothetical protein
VLIDVLDVNDNAPAFTKRIYSAVVPENVAVGTDVITVAAVDPDDGAGGELSYDLSNEGEASGLFVVNRSTGRIVTRKALTGKGRTEPYHLMVRAQDGGKPSLSMDVPLSLFIGDVFTNDGVPIFIRPTLNEVAKIPEVRFLLITLWYTVLLYPTLGDKLFFKCLLIHYCLACCFALKV